MRDSNPRRMDIAIHVLLSNQSLLWVPLYQTNTDEGQWLSIGSPILKSSRVTDLPVLV